MTRTAIRPEAIPQPVDEPVEPDFLDQDDERPPITFAEARAKAVGIFESDEEVDEFIAFVTELRRMEVA